MSAVDIKNNQLTPGDVAAIETSFTALTPPSPKSPDDLLAPIAHQSAVIEYVHQLMDALQTMTDKERVFIAGALARGFLLGQAAEIKSNHRARKLLTRDNTYVRSPRKRFNSRIGPPSRIVRAG